MCLYLYKPWDGLISYLKHITQVGTDPSSMDIDLERMRVLEKVNKWTLSRDDFVLHVGVLKWMEALLAV